MNRPWRWDISEEHLQDAGFLWTQRELALESPRYTLAEVAEGVEERLLANLDGLVAGGPALTQRLLVPVLEDGSADPELLAVAALATLEGSSPDAEEIVLTGLSFDAPEARAAVMRALELSSRPGLEGALRPFLAGGGPAAEAALRVLAARGLEPDPALDRFIASEDLALSLAALRLAGASPEHHVRTAIEEALGSPDPSVQTAALEAGLVARLEPAWEVALGAVKEGRAPPVALTAVAAGGSAREVAEVIALLEFPERRAGALVALGYSGSVAAAEACLPFLEDPEVGALAAEAFAAITGAPQRQLSMEPPPEDQEAPPDEEMEEIPEEGPEQELVRFDPTLAGKWWTKQKRAFAPRARYLRGAPWSVAALTAALRDGPMRRRRWHALELAIRTGQAPVDTRRWARVQLSSPPSTARFDDRTFGDLCRR